MNNSRENEYYLAWSLFYDLCIIEKKNTPRVGYYNNTSSNVKIAERLWAYYAG